MTALENPMKANKVNNAKVLRILKAFFSMLFFLKK